MKLTPRLSIISLMALSLLPFSQILFDANGQFSIGVAGSLTGLIATVLFFWQLLIGTRFLVSKFTRDILSVNWLHKFIGKYATLLVLTHPILVSLSYFNSLQLLLEIKYATEFDRQVIYGRIALYLFIIIWISSVILKGKIKYRPWLYLHYLGYIMVGLLLFHAKDIGSSLRSYPFLTMYWQVLIIGYLSLICFRLLKWAGFGQPVYELTSKKKLASDVYQYTFKPLSGTAITPRVGQFCYIQAWKWGETHPFTVMEFNENTGELIFGIKTSGKYTTRLTTLEKGSVVNIDGPYGVFTKEGHGQKPKILIAGGIGITPFVELVDEFGDNQTYMFYSNKTKNEAVKRDQLKHKLNIRYFDAVTQEVDKEKQVINGRLSAETIQQLTPKGVFAVADFFICGPQPFYSAIAKGLENLGISKKKIHYEAFGL